MKTFLVQNAFISNSAQSDTCADTAVAPKPQPPLPDATAVLNSVSPDVHIAPHNFGEREPVSDAGLPSGESSSDGQGWPTSNPSTASVPSIASARSVTGLPSEASAAIDPVREPVAAVDLNALWDCIQPPTRDATAVLPSELKPSCDVRAGAPAEINVAGYSSPMHDERTWEQLRALTNGDSLVLEPKLIGRGSCDSGAANSEPSGAVDLQALWDCITDDRFVLVGRGDDPDRPMFLETFRLGEAAAQ